MKRPSISIRTRSVATSLWLLGASCLLTVGCSPQLSIGGNGGIFSRSSSKTTASAESRNAQPVVVSAQPVSTENASSSETAADGQSTAENTTALNPVGIPKVTEEAVSELKNVTIVNLDDAEQGTAANYAYSGGASTQVSAVASPVSKRQRRAVEKQRKTKTAQTAESTRSKRSGLLKANASTTASSSTVSAAPQSASTSATASAAAPAAAQNDDGEISVEDFLPGAPRPVVAQTLTDNGSEAEADNESENSVAASPREAAPEQITPETFKPNEMEHVKFSYYDPFGDGTNRFTVDLSQQRFCYPYPGKFLSGYGPRGRSMHTGVDIKGVRNDTIRAAFAGTVRMSKPYSGYGNCVVIRHKNGLETLYSHNSRNLVRVGDVVQAGDPIALIGRTGRATTDHCHFEVRVQGQHINPALLLDYENHTLRAGVLTVTKRSNGRILASNQTSGQASSESEEKDSESAIAAGGGETRLASTSQRSSSASSSSSSASKSSSGSSSIYTVRSGDTLWGIARRYGTTVAKLCALNNLDSKATLPLGKKLKIR